jgi:hypothetical protein
LGGFGFYYLERGKSHYNIILTVSDEEKVILRNSSPPILLIGTRTFKKCRGQTNGIRDNLPQKYLKNLILNQQNEEQGQNPPTLPFAQWWLYLNKSHADQ